MFPKKERTPSSLGTSALTTNNYLKIAQNTCMCFVISHSLSSSIYAICLLDTFLSRHLVNQTIVLILSMHHVMFYRIEYEKQHYYQDNY
jgi:hypothetical protein